jgi:hypothetical protein
MYPLTRKNTKTPYWPRLSQWYRKSLTDCSSSVDPWSKTTHSAANPRSASSQASLPAARDVREGGMTLGIASLTLPPGG